MIQLLAPGHDSPTLSITHLFNPIELFHLKDSFSFQIVSWSMFPTLWKGDRIHIEKSDTLKPGDLLVYQQEDFLVCHRVMNIGVNNLIWVQGDFSSGTCEAIPREQVVGIVSMIFRGSKQFPPISPLPPTWMEHVRKRIWQGWDQLREHIRQSILSILQLLWRGNINHQVGQRLLGRLLNFSVGVPGPIRLVDGYQFFHLGRTPLSMASFTKLPISVKSAQNPILAIRLGSLPLGTYHGISGELALRQLGLHLPIQDPINSAIQQFREWQRLSS